MTPAPAVATFTVKGTRRMNKLTLHSLRSEPQAGGALPGLLSATLVAGLALLALLQILPKPVYPVASSELWMACLPYVEAGVEEALKSRGFDSSSLMAGGWTTTSGGRHGKTNTLAGGGYAVNMSSGAAYEILCSGYVRVPGTARTVQRTARINAQDLPAFRFALLTRDPLDVGHVRIDSFDSRDPINSPSGRYVASNARDRAVVARVEHPLTFPDVPPPPADGLPSGGTGTTVGGVIYDQVFAQGSYKLSSLNGKSLVTGLAIVQITGDINADLIVIQTNAWLRLYGGAATRIGQVDNQSRLASHLLYFGLPGNTSLSLGSGWVGVVCAPDGELSVKDGGDFCGSLCVRSLVAEGGFKLHYDEALGVSTNGIRSIITSWTEL